MDQWYYAKAGQQHGPVTLAELQALLRNGALNPASDLVWNASMTDWLAAAQVPALSGGAPAPEASYGTQPFAYPLASGALGEIPVGAEPIIPTACVKRAFDLTVKHIGFMIGITLLYFIISWAIDASLPIADKALGWAPGEGLPAHPPAGSGAWGSFQHAYVQESMSIPMTVLSHAVTVFFMLGFIRIGLNVVSGKPFGIGMLFGGGKWLLQGIIGYLLYGLMVGVGLILFIVPGVYLMLRFGMFQNAIVDRNLSAIAALRYSSELTTNNRANLFVLFLFAIVIIFAGCAALLVGMLFAYPVMWLSWIVAYRWMQYGGRAVLDDPATGQPMLSSLPD
jgi:hypothetical protein